MPPLAQLMSCLLWLGLLRGVQGGVNAGSNSRPLRFLFVPILGNSPAIDMLGLLLSCVAGAMQWQSLQCPALWLSCGRQYTLR
ncbi:hypothetical protein COO60DRAFT_144007 [Scenedesmus sp. NREL 46B-D3]|nr:hypothetical protein COO60DRAFT_144007 [Scenedesmus sp. NREL 46B-D3]